MSSAFITLKGDKALQKKINAAARRAPQKLDKLLARTAFDLQIVAIDSIRMPPKTGKIYKRRSVTHQASSPGQAPAFDTGTLARNIQSQRDGFLNHSVGSRQDAPHGLFLEFGTSKMAARPWLIPAKRKIDKIFKIALRKLVIHGR